jgi:hypothetical protein
MSNVARTPENMNTAKDIKTADAPPRCAPSGGSVTVAYSIVNDKEWGATNPLRYEHNGLKAHTVAVYDAFERLEIFREALEKIAELNTGFSSDADKMNQIAKQALGESQNDDEAHGLPETARAPRGEGSEK